MTAPRRCGSTLKNVVSKHLLRIKFMSISFEIDLKWMSQNTFDDKSTLVWVNAWCRQVTSHYLSQCWPRTKSTYSVIKPRWIKLSNEGHFFLKRNRRLCLKNVRGCPPLRMSMRISYSNKLCYILFVISLLRTIFLCDTKFRYDQNRPLQTVSLTAWIEIGIRPKCRWRDEEPSTWVSYTGTLAQIMVWSWAGDKPLSELMITMMPTLLGSTTGQDNLWCCTRVPVTKLS